MNSSAPRALVVDDESLIAFVTEDILRSKGYEVVVATSREQLESALVLQGYALAVTDTDLATANEMSSWNVDRIVLCSGKPREDIERDFPSMEYVLKPFSEEQLLSILYRTQQSGT